MSTASARSIESRSSGGFMSSLMSRQLDSYPNTGPRMGYLGLVVVITTALYYELYVGGSVASLQLATLHMSFSFYVLLLAFGNLIGAFGSLAAGLADRLGRCNLVVVGLLITGVMVAFVLPDATTKWSFGVEGFAVGLVEGICLVATPALIRDFSPQVGRGAAMGFWTMGPVLGSLVVSVVGSNTINAQTQWPHEYRICGIVGLVVFVLAFFFLRELSPGLRDQLMVTTRDRVLIEAKAKGLDIEATLKHPFRQLLRPEIVISAIGVSVLLLSYYTAVAFGTIYFETIFGFTLKQANGLGNWNWGINAISLVIAGVISDRFRVRKPFMILGGAWAAIAMIFYLSAAGTHSSYYHIALLTSVLSFGLGIGYVAWMAGFTESVEARNPALTATGLAIWGWIIRVTIFGSFLVLPLVINTVNPLVNYGATVGADAAQYPAFAFASSHPQLVTFATENAATLDFAAANPALVTFATKNAATLGFAAANPGLVASASAHAAQLAQVQKYAPELQAVAAHPALFAALAKYTNPATIPASLLAQAATELGGASQATTILTTIATHKAAITAAGAFAQANPTLIAGATKYGAQLTALGTLNATQPALLKQAAADGAQLTALAKLNAASPALLAQAAANGKELTALAAIPKPVVAFMSAHAGAVVAAAAKSPHQWKDWYWICFGGMVAFLLCTPLARGRWSPSKAKADEDAHEAMVQAELAKLNA
jgi:MFS family permease